LTLCEIPFISYWLLINFARKKIDNNNPLDSVIGNAFMAHESVKASLALLLAGNES